MSSNVVKFSRQNLGVILIEFAFAIPIFLVLIYYLHDLPKMRLMQRKMQFVAYEMASILQNIADQKTTALTKNDIKASMRIAYLSIYFGNTMNSTEANDNYFPLGHFPFVNIAIVKNYSGALQIVNQFFVQGGMKDKFQFGWFLPPASIDPLTFASKFNFTDGEIKVILDCCSYYYWDNNKMVFADGRKTNEVSRREAFGFLFINPQGSGSAAHGFFPGVASFTPPPQAFSETSGPQ